MPEGCSSRMFPALMGEQTAQRMLGEEGWVPTGAEAVEVGLADELVPHDRLLDRARQIAAGWVAQGRARTFRGGFTLEQLRAINAEESEALADAFLAVPFLKGRYHFFRSKGKTQTALMFWTLWRTRPLWSRLL